MSIKKDGDKYLITDRPGGPYHVTAQQAAGSVLNQFERISGVAAGLAFLANAVNPFYNKKEVQEVDEFQQKGISAIIQALSYLIEDVEVETNVSREVLKVFSEEKSSNTTPTVKVAA
jgi:hypothetical protein